MLRKLALKKLKASDLSFFKAYLTSHPQAKQKGFNLNKSVVEKQFFPALTTSLQPLKKKAVHVDLTMFGPGLAEAHHLARKIKQDAKNIRLNGEFIDGPVSEPNRYDIVAPGDFAIMEFIGTAIPEAVNVVLIAAAHPDDASLHAKLAAMLPNPADSMSILSEDVLIDAVAAAAPSASHPIREWLESGLLEEVGYGDAKAVEKLNQRRPGRGISPADFKVAKESAERTGRLGEELLDQFFQSKGLPGIATHQWTAQLNAVSPYDFLLADDAEGTRHADAKSTSGKFSNPLYMSIAEIHHAIGSNVPYDIIRLYNVKETSATFKIAKDVRTKLLSVLDAFANVPAGVNVDSLSFNPVYFDFETDEYFIEIATEDDDVDE